MRPNEVREHMKTSETVAFLVAKVMGRLEVGSLELMEDDYPIEYQGMCHAIVDMTQQLPEPDSPWRLGT